MPRFITLVIWLALSPQLQAALDFEGDKPKQPKPNTPLPMTGKEVPELAAFDNAMLKFMNDRNTRAGTLSVSKNSKVLLSRGYGHLDPANTHLCGPDTPMRIASVSKPITLALLLHLIRQGKISWDTQPFVYLGVRPPAGKKMDPQLLKITIKQLVEHKGGWDRDKAGDPMFMPLKIAAALDKTGPVSPRDIITYMAGQPLQFEPGSKSVYSNFGYCVLGRVIEKATGKSYIDSLHDVVTRPLGIKSFELGRTLPKFRNPKEPVYVDPGTGTNVMRPKNKVNVPSPDGGFHLEAMDAHGGLIASAPDLVRFLDAYWMDGSPRKMGESRTYSFFGSLPGTWSVVIQRADGVNIAALFNQRTDPSGLPYEAIRKMLNAAATNVKG
jgi:CubicO group peptidase (beta-lactamase class C family)